VPRETELVIVCSAPKKEQLVRLREMIGNAAAYWRLNLHGWRLHLFAFVGKFDTSLVVQLIGCTLPM